MAVSSNAPLQSALRILVGHAIWSRDVTWAQQWFQTFLKPLFADGLFLPPLLAFDLRSAAERGERRYGKFADSRADLPSWKEFMLWMHSITVERLPPGVGAHADSRNAAALRVAKILALNLMCRTDVSSLRTTDHFDAAAAVIHEAQRIQGDAGAAERHGPMWAVIEQIVKTERFEDLIPSCESLTANERRAVPIDPFLPKLLMDSKSKRSNLQEPPIQGRVRQADSPRKILAAAGEFARRDLGGLPDNLGRLAPTELLLLHEAFRGGATQHPIVESDGFRTLFLLRASQSGLLQRFHYDTESAHTQPTVCLEIELADDPNDHRLSDPPRPPTISHYRAVVVHLFHQFARLANEFEWSLHAVLTHNTMTLRHQSTLDRQEIQQLANSAKEAIEPLVSRCPSAFVAARSRQPIQRASLAEPEGEFDLAIRIVVGPESIDRDDRIQRANVRARVERAIRVERRRDGSWGWSVSDACGNAQRLDVTEFSWDIDEPATLATKLIMETLGVEPESVDLEIE